MIKQKYYTILFYGDGYNIEYLGEFDNYVNAQSAAWLKYTARTNVVSEAILKDIKGTIEWVLKTTNK